MEKISPSLVQLDRYRQMTGEQRLAIALQMHEFACDITREGIRRQFPEESADQHEERLRVRIRASKE